MELIQVLPQDLDQRIILLWDKLRIFMEDLQLEEKWTLKMLGRKILHQAKSTYR